MIHGSQRSETNADSSRTLPSTPLTFGLFKARTAFFTLSADDDTMMTSAPASGKASAAPYPILASPVPSECAFNAIYRLRACLPRTAADHDDLLTAELVGIATHCCRCDVYVYLSGQVWMTSRSPKGVTGLRGK
jgi:hypothetical protein